MSEHTIEAGPGWSLQRVAGLFCLGIATGAVLGAIAGYALMLITWSLAYFIIVIIVAGATGAVIATVAGVGSIVGLLVADRWGEKPPRYRMIAAGVGAAITLAATTCLLVLSSDWAESPESLLLIPFVALIGGFAAAFGIGLFEQRMRVRDSTRLRQHPR
ncbi:hypothetical protein [Marisediminicola sp. LYQ134]|uniref:hypothetical protein n=1 Tax=Marisediminicola sp. LYQ134 TaxID=3391061 RepID=UPI003982F4BB